MLARLVFPLLCPGCGARAEPVCAACAASLRPAPVSAAPRGVDAWFAVFAFEGVAREVVARVKYRRAHAAVPWLASCMARAAPAPDGFVVTWPPTTGARRRERGFDHAELLARALARELRLPVAALLRRGAGAPQTGLSASARRVGPGFSPRRPAPPRVLLVDDVATTGGTLSAAAGVLRAAGASTVIAVTAARTPGP